MDINNLQKTIQYSYWTDDARAYQQLRQEEKRSMQGTGQCDSVDISVEGRKALEEKMYAMRRMGQLGEPEKLTPLNAGFYGMINDFEKVMSELGGGSVSCDFVTNDYLQADVDALKSRYGKDSVKTDSFDSYVNKMVSAYQMLRDRIENKYASSDREKEYYVAEDGSKQELSKEKELEMLDKAYETHSRFMASSTQIWSELQNFKARTVYHSRGAKAGASDTKHQNTGVKEQAYEAFMSAVSSKNIGLLNREIGRLNNVRLHLGISSSSRSMLNGIWNYYADLKK